MKKLVCGIGINDADYTVEPKETTGSVGGKLKRRRVWSCPFYRVWVNMIIRCYSEKALEKNATYRGCSVSAAWLTFSNFKSWMEQQDYEGKQLDKDLLFPSNKIYSPETCVFVYQLVNTFVTESNAMRGEWPIGVSWYKAKQQFVARCRNPFTKRLEHLDYFTCPIEAHEAWLERKLELAELLAAEQDDPRVAKALVERYENYEQS